MAAEIHIYDDKARRYRWRLVAPNSRITADSGFSYESRSAARKAAETVRSEVGGASILDK
jgi:uncharacterized protein YegP (UPF0339 family)